MGLDSKGKWALGCGGVLFGTMAICCGTASIMAAAIWNRNETNLLLEQASLLSTQVDPPDNQVYSLAEEVASLNKENTNLRAVLLQLEEQGVPEKQIDYVVRTVTKLVPSGEPVVIYKEMPAHHLFELQDGIPVAEFWSQPTGFRFETYELSIRNTLVVSPDKSAVLTEVASSADGIWHPVSTELSTVYTEQPKYPRVALHTASGMSFNPIHTFVPQPSLSIPWLHLTPELDILSPGVAAGTYSYGFVNIIGYNIGKPLPLLDNLWLSTGPTIDLNKKIGGAASLEIKL